MSTPVMLSLFGRLAGAFLVPAKTASAFARRRGRGRPSGRRAQRARLDGGEHEGKLSSTGALARTSRASRAAALVLLGLAAGAMAQGASGQEPGRAAADDVTQAAVDEAAARFGLPHRWLRAVIAVESRGDASAVSPKGAMGLMQLMPGTWAELRRELGLGADSFDRRDNVLAGAAYLRRLYDRFGAAGAFAAYNCGPARYEAHLSSTAPLPAETRAYVASIARRLGQHQAPAEVLVVRMPDDWRAAPLFVGAALDIGEGAK